MTAIDGVSCVGRACDKQTRDTFQSSCLSGVRLLAVITLQTVWRVRQEDEVGHEIIQYIASCSKSDASSIRYDAVPAIDATHVSCY